MTQLQRAAEEAMRLLRSNVRRGRSVRDGRGKKSTKHSFTHQRNTATLYLIYQGWSGDAIAEHLDCHRSTIYRFRDSLQLKPWLLFDYPVLSQGVRALTVIWTCEVCGSTFAKLSKRKAREHVAFHYFPREVVISVGVFGEWYE